MTSAATANLIRGACPHDCPDSCATLTEVKDGKAIRFIADPAHPITDGWLCAKVRPYLDRVYAADRLQYPLRRCGAKGAGDWQRITWDEALDELATRWQSIIAEFGAAAILPYSYSGTLGLVENLVAASRFWNRLGASGLERSICDAAAHVAVTATIGAKWAPDPRDVLQSKVILIWGNNPASTNPHFMPILREAQRKGTRVIVIDPRRTLTARSADLHIAPKPATDGALALGMMHEIFERNLHDGAWLDANSIGWQELRQRCAQYPVSRVSEITGLSIETITDLATVYSSQTPSMIKVADGLQRHENGGQTFRAVLALPAITGQYGKLGGGVFYSQSGHISWDAEAVGKASQCPPTPRIVNMVRLGAALNGEVTDPPIKSLYVFAANPVTSTPNSSETIKGLLREDLFTVVHEQFMTDTARYADIVLPATTQLEQTDLMKPYGHQHLQYNHKAIAPLGECRSNWTVMRSLAAAMDFREPWLYEEPEQVIDEVLTTTKSSNSLLDGITLAGLQEEGTLPYSLPDNYVPFADLKFPTPSGKVELSSEAMISQGQDPLPDYHPPREFADWRRDEEPLVLISGAAHHFVSSSMANQPGLLAKEGPPSVEIHPDDAAPRGICDGDLVELVNDRGSCQLNAKVTTSVRRGVLVSVKGHWGSLAASDRNVNWLTSDRLADLGNQATFHSNLVALKRIPNAEVDRHVERAATVAAPAD